MHLYSKTQVAILILVSASRWQVCKVFSTISSFDYSCENRANVLTSSIKLEKRSVSRCLIQNEKSIARRSRSNDSDEEILDEVLYLVREVDADGKKKKLPNPASLISLNSTDLSIKVETEMMNEYDECFPGPLPGQQVRPLKINLDLLSFQAREQMKRGNTDESLRLYQLCVELDPRDGRGWMGLARYESKRKNYDKARSLWDDGLRYDPYNPYLLQAYGVMEENIGNIKQALNLYIKATKADPKHSASWVALAMLYRRQNRTADARRCFEAATNADPAGYYAWQAWGVLEESEGNYDLAREKFARSARANSRNAALFQAWGVMEGRLENFQTAVELFKRGMEENPKSAFILQAWAVMEFRCGQSERAEMLFKKALSINSKDPAIYQAFSLLRKKQNDLQGARSLLRRALEIDKTHSPSWQALGMLEAEAGDLQCARKMFQQGVWYCSKSNEKVRLFQSWGIAEARSKNYNQARKCFRYGLEQNGSSLPVLIAWALMEEEADNIVRSKQLFEVAVSIKSRGNSNESIWLAYEAMERRCGNFEEANRIRERAAAACSSKTGNFSLANDPFNKVAASKLGKGLPGFDDVFATTFGTENLGKMVFSQDFMDFQYMHLGPT